MNINNDNSLYDISKEKIAPALFSYVNWIIENAKKRNISTLYFLARDGYVLKQIAELICKQNGLSMECRYLYCSRASLRMPTYYFIGDEAFDLIFSSGYHVTLATFAERIGMDEKEWMTVLEESGVSKNIDIAAELSEQQIFYYKKKLHTDKRLIDFLEKKSRKAYDLVVRYFQQEEMIEKNQIAIVDSGWVGSMQRSIRQLLQHIGWKGKIIGFYFGLYAQQRAEDGEYLCYYFNCNKDLKNKVLFCNNLFEIILSAPHGTTIGYEKEKKCIKPILQKTTDNEQNEKIKEQINGIVDGTKEILSQGIKYEKKDCQKILRKIMGDPSIQISKLYGSFMFCDDITDMNRFYLNDLKSKKDVKELLVWRRIWVRISKKKKEQLFWDYGAITLIRNPIKRKWYWLNSYLWKILQYTIRH